MGPTGGFCLEYESASVDTCAVERDTVMRVEGDAVGVLTSDASTDCDGCMAFVLDGVEGEPYCP